MKCIIVCVLVHIWYMKSIRGVCGTRKEMVLQWRKASNNSGGMLGKSNGAKKRSVKVEAMEKH